jgi:V/A-type H+-transporting ATPase subunit I
MVKVGLFFLAEDAAAVVSVLGRLGAWQVVQPPTELQDFLTPFFPEPFRDAFRRLREYHEALAQRWQTVGEASLETVEPRVPSVEDMERLSGELEPLHRQAQDLDQRTRHWRERQAALEHFDAYVRALAKLDIDVKDLADLRFLHLRAGSVPRENVERLQESAALGEDLVLHLGSVGDRDQVLVVGAGGVTPELEGLLAKAHFEPLEPAPTHSARQADDIDAPLAGEASAIRAKLQELEGEEDRLRRRGRKLLQDSAQVLARATVFAECDGALQGRAPVAFVSGWAPGECLPELEQVLAREVPNPVVLLREPTPAGDGSPPPSDMAVPAVFRPGVSLVSLYGLPGYDEINPTLVLALTMPLLFGMMFGDVGFGLLLALAGLVCRRRLGHWLAPVLSCSLGSVAFGLLYGSVFGVEHWLPALWLRPIEAPFRLLAAALWIGVAFVLMTFVLKALSLVRQGRRHEAVFGFQAGAGAACYLGAVALCQAVFRGQGVPWAALGLILLGLVATAVNAASEVRAHGLTALTDLATEYFHGTLTLLTNTLSFLRLAAFALAHAALTKALFLLVAMLPPTLIGWLFRILLLAAGSVLILVLDVLAVAVQTIRLEFYEGLARYYRGDGQAYQPLRFPGATRS